MSNKVRWILIAIALMILGLVVVGVSYVTGKKSIYGPDGAPVPPPMDAAQPLQLNRFDLGEFIAVSRDDELHYIKIEVTVSYLGNLDKELADRKAELRDAITNILMRLTISRAKEDILDRFLHKDIENRLNQVLGRATSESRITEVFIPSFLIN